MEGILYLICPSHWGPTSAPSFNVPNNIILSKLPSLRVQYGQKTQKYAADRFAYSVWRERTHFYGVPFMNTNWCAFLYEAFISSTTSQRQLISFCLHSGLSRSLPCRETYGKLGFGQAVFLCCYCIQIIFHIKNQPAT